MNIFTVKEIHNSRRVSDFILRSTDGWLPSKDKFYGKIAVIDGHVYQLDTWMNLFTIIPRSESKVSHVNTIINEIIKWITKMNVNSDMLNNCGLTITVYTDSKDNYYDTFIKSRRNKTIFGEDVFKRYEYHKVLKFDKYGAYQESQKRTTPSKQFQDNNYDMVYILKQKALNPTCNCMLKFYN